MALIELLTASPSSFGAITAHNPLKDLGNTRRNRVHPTANAPLNCKNEPKIPIFERGATTAKNNPINFLLLKINEINKKDHHQTKGKAPKKHKHKRICTIMMQKRKMTRKKSKAQERQAGKNNIRIKQTKDVAGQNKQEHKCNQPLAIPSLTRSRISLPGLK